MYEFIRGPLAWFSFTIFFLGTVFQIVRFIFLSRKMPRVSRKKKFFRNALGEYKRDPQLRSLVPFIARARATIIGTYPVMTFVTLVFHVAIFMLPIFLLSHNSLFGVLWGVSFCPYVFSGIGTDIMTGIVFVCILFFLLRRVFLKNIRAITSFHDIYMLLVSAAPFLTGYLAIREIYDYKILITLHVLSAELLLVSVPFTKLIHMAYFVINRFFLIGEYGIRDGRRVW